MRRVVPSLMRPRWWYRVTESGKRIGAGWPIFWAVAFVASVLSYRWLTDVGAELVSSICGLGAAFVSGRWLTAKAPTDER